MSSNDNNKIRKKESQRQEVVVATYYSPHSIFKISKGKDINKAHSHWVKYNLLYIYWTKEDEDK